MKNVNVEELNVEELTKVNGGKFATYTDCGLAAKVVFRTNVDDNTKRAIAGVYSEFFDDEAKHTYQEFMEELKRRRLLN